MIKRINVYNTQEQLLWCTEKPKGFVPSGALMLATTMRNDIIEKLDMAGFCVLTKSPNKPKAAVWWFERIPLRRTSTVLSGMYCQSLDMCASLYTHFL